MSPEPLEFPLERDYFYYDQIQRERGLPYAYKLVVDEAIKLRLFAADCQEKMAAAEEAAHSALDLLEAERQKTVALETELVQAKVARQRLTDSRNYWEDMWGAVERQAQELAKERAALEAHLAAMSQDLLRVQGVIAAARAVAAQYKVTINRGRGMRFLDLIGDESSEDDKLIALIDALVVLESP